MIFAISMILSDTACLAAGSDGHFNQANKIESVNSDCAALALVPAANFQLQPGAVNDFSLWRLMRAREGVP
jgi:hypothetical protein